MRVTVEDAQVEGQKKKYEGNKTDPDEHVVAFGQEISAALFALCAVVLPLDAVMRLCHHRFQTINARKRRFVDFMPLQTASIPKLPAVLYNLATNRQARIHTAI